MKAFYKYLSCLLLTACMAHAQVVVIDWDDIDSPTTLDGYGITDAATAAQGALADTALQTGDAISGTTLTVTNGVQSTQLGPIYFSSGGLTSTWPTAAGIFLTSGNIGSSVQAYDADLDTIAANGSAYYLDWDNFTDTPTTLSGYGISDAQSLDSDLTAIAALSTTAYGRALLESVDDASLFGAIKQTATTSATGVLELGTQTEIDAGATDKAVTGETLLRHVSSKFAARAPDVGMHSRGVSNVANAVLPAGPKFLWLNCFWPDMSDQPFTDSTLIQAGSISAQGFRASIYQSSSSSFRLTQYGATTNDFIRCTFDMDDYVGQPTRVLIQSNGSGQPEVFVNGHKVTLSTDSTSGAGAAWQDFEDESLEGVTVGGADSVYLATAAGNAHVSDSDAEASARFGWGALAKYISDNGGGYVSYMSDFSVDANGFLLAATDTTVAGNQDSINSQNDWLSLTKSSIASSTQLRATRIDTLTPGKVQRLTARLFFDAGITGMSYLSIGQSNSLGASALRQVVPVVAGTQVDVDVTGLVVEGSNADYLYIFASNSDGTGIAAVDAGDKVSVTSVEVSDVGLCGWWQFDRNIGSQVPDKSGANNPLLRSSTGTQFLTAPERRSQITGSLTWSGTHEAKALLADQALLPSNAVIESIIVTTTASTTGSGLSIGDGDTTSYWVAVAAHTANTPVYEALAKRFPASSATADLKIYVDPDTANYTGTVNVSINYVLK